LVEAYAARFFLAMSLSPSNDLSLEEDCVSSSRATKSSMSAAAASSMQRCQWWQHPSVGAGGCDDHHEMSDLVAVGEPAHRSDDSVAPVWPHQRSDGPRCCMEKIMSKTNDTEKTRELNDAELAAVTGGVVNAAVAGAIKGAVWGEFRPKTTGCYRPYRATPLTSSAP
jgi:hypothetical protein